MLLLNTRWVFAQVPQPLVPLGWNFDGGEVRVAGVLDDAAPAGGRGVVVATDIAKFPVRVSLEVKACLKERCEWAEREWGGGQKGRGRGGNVPTRNLLRHGRRRAFHLYHVRKRGEICFEDIGPAILDDVSKRIVCDG